MPPEVDGEGNFDPEILKKVDIPEGWPTEADMQRFCSMHPDKYPIAPFTLPKPPLLNFDTEKLEAFKQKLRDALLQKEDDA